MRNILLILMIVLTTRTYGQLKVDAGNDTAICVSTTGFDTLKIGGNPTASGGVEPYIYTWSGNYVISSNSISASHFLDDSTFSNPKITNPTLDYLKLKLVVTDNAGETAEDSITVRFSIFWYLTIECMHFINQGDTITLSGNMGQGIGPLTYTWSPNYNISDTLAAGPNAWPDTTTYYQVYATDSIGCISDPSTCSIYVDPTGISYIKNDLIKSEVIPNPINSNSKILFGGDFMRNSTIQVFNSKGQVILLDKISSDTYMIGDKIIADGFYIYVIKNGNIIVSNGKFVRK